MFKLRFAFVAIVLSTLPALAQPNGPAATIAALLKLDTKGDWTPIFANEPTPAMQRYFTPAFNAAWRKAMKHNADYPVFDADPLTGAQNTGGPIVQSIEANARGTVTAKMTYKAAPAIQVSVSYLMVRDGAHWRIDDVIYRDNRPSLRAVLGGSR